MEPQAKYLAAVIGAGPAGLFAARELASQNVHVTLINRDLKPGGLAEYGIFPTKHRMKEGLRAQFRQILALEDIDYYGNLTVGENSDIKLAELRALGHQAILVTTGAQGTKWLGSAGGRSGRRLPCQRRGLSLQPASAFQSEKISFRAPGGNHRRGQCDA